MSRSDVDCALILQRMGRYHDGDLPEDQADRFEQHLLQCPPCLVEVRRLRAALRYLTEAAASVPPTTSDAVAAELAERLTPGPGPGSGTP